MPTKQRPLSPIQAEALIQAIRRQPLTGTSSRELAHLHGVHYQTVANYRRKLKLAGQLTLAPGTSAPALAPTLVALETEDIARSLEISTPEEILQRLTFLSKSPSVPATTQVVASKALYDIREAEASREKLSATLPATRAEALARLRILRSAVGPDLWAAADQLVSQEEHSWDRLTPPPDLPTPAATATSSSLPPIPEA